MTTQAINIVIFSRLFSSILVELALNYHVFTAVLRQTYAAKQETFRNSHHCFCFETFVNDHQNFRQRAQHGISREKIRAVPSTQLLEVRKFFSFLRFTTGRLSSSEAQKAEELAEKANKEMCQEPRVENMRTLVACDFVKHGFVKVTAPTIRMHEMQRIVTDVRGVCHEGTE